MKYSFKSDYSEGAHPAILEALQKTNLSQQESYGIDEFSRDAVAILRRKLKNQNADIHFVSGGTQANLIVISALLKPYESVIAADRAHIAVHEAGAIESTGHKINTVKTSDGKLTPQDVLSVLQFHEDEHMVKPKLVFISNATELGSVWNKKELQELSACCKAHNLFLYMDGARIGSALCSQESDLALADISRLVDVFYIGGTKNGALLGEAVIINNRNLQENFRFHLKQRGALLAKGRVLGVQFATLFKDDLFFDLANHANKMASQLSCCLEQAGYQFLTKPVSNMIFPVLPNKLIEKLSKKFDFYVWQKIDDSSSAIRLVTSWATTQEAVESFIKQVE